MSSTQSAYSSTAAEVLSVADHNRMKAAAFHDAMLALSGEFGQAPHYTDSFGSQRRFAGFAAMPTTNLAGLVPWRQDRRGMWWPKRTTSAGKAMGARFDAPTFEWESLPGMPSYVMGDGVVRNFGYFVHDGTVWASWSCSHDWLEIHCHPGTLDTDLWDRQPLSAYYAAKETAARSTQS